MTNRRENGGGRPREAEIDDTEREKVDHPKRARETVEGVRERNTTGRRRRRRAEGDVVPLDLNGSMYREVIVEEEEERDRKYRDARKNGAR